MPKLSLPDGKILQFDEPVTLRQAAQSIGPGLAKVVVAGLVDGVASDLDRRIDHDAAIQLLKPEDPEGLEIVRHSAAHLLAQAIKRLYPQAQLAIGPTTENGFYYDIDLEHRLSEDDLPVIEETMQQIVKEDLPVNKFYMDRQEAIQFYEAHNEPYKVEILQDMETTDEVSFYQQGEFIDLCRGPHTPSTSHIKAFKLMKLAGAYWRGDANRPMLQRIYGTAWPDKRSLKQYLQKLEEAAQRDHRLLAKKMGLFHIQEEAPGMIFWHPRGWQLYRVIQHYMREKQEQYGYQEICTPQILARKLWEDSGHWYKFEDDMFLTHSEDHEFLVKPMNCPGHVQVFKQGTTSYRDMPIRLAEFGSCLRNEPSGTLHGLLRLRHFVQDDAHIFCTPEQLLSEITAFFQQLQEVYRDFGFQQIIFYLSTRPEHRIGTDEVWTKAESALEQSLNQAELDWVLQPGEGAFYGPKVEFSLKDCLGRLWQCGTIQVDFITPQRLGADYIDEHGQKQTPVMLHRAILGSMERFIGILLEEYAGDLPLWLAPVQVKVLNITQRQEQYCRQVIEKLRACGLRAEGDLRNEKINYKIREHTISRVPYMLVIGDQEMERGQVTVRTQRGENRGSIQLDKLVEQVKREVNVKATERLVNAQVSQA